MARLPDLSKFRPYLRPALAGGITAGVAVFFHLMAGDTAKIVEAKAKEFGETPGVDWANPLTWANAPRELIEEIQMAQLTLQLAILTFLKYAVIALGSIVTLYFVWQDVIMTPAERHDFERRQFQAVMEYMKTQRSQAEATGQVAQSVGQVAAASGGIG